MIREEGCVVVRKGIPLWNTFEPCMECPYRGKISCMEFKISENRRFAFATIEILEGGIIEVVGGEVIEGEVIE